MAEYTLFETYLTIFLAAFATFGWRVSGLILSGFYPPRQPDDEMGERSGLCDGSSGINTHSGLSHGVLATTPLDYRLVCLGLGLALMFFSKKLWLALIGSMGAFAILVTYFWCVYFSYNFRGL